MNKELIEKINGLREDLRALESQGTEDLKKLADLVIQKDPMGVMWDKYRELLPYMTMAQGSRANNGLSTLRAMAEQYPERGEEHDFTDHFTHYATFFLPQLIAGLDDLDATLRWLSSIADHMGCPLSELLRYKPPFPWFYETKTASESEDPRLT